MTRPGRRCVARDGRGAAIVEFAIVGSIFITLLVGTIEIGLLCWTRNTLQVTAALTARCVALATCAADPDGFAAAEAADWGLPNVLSGVTVTANANQCNGQTTASGQFVTVVLQSQYWANLPPPLSAVTLHASACYPIAS
ncbi:TadE/TadG family type IV pilus assembly protein [Nguyenibacter vanlangensis]|uniref:TadE/TadG family type IV pilus assembly protein n=1 Tax=Nguyenibacter vanlangensis TaxID=1216886 RepID=A0ABZ3D6M8_9PROT